MKKQLLILTMLLSSLGMWAGDKITENIYSQNYESFEVTSYTGSGDNAYTSGTIDGWIFCTSAYNLSGQGLDRKNQYAYTQSGWLVHMSKGVYKIQGTTPTLLQTVFAFNMQQDKRGIGT